MEYGYRLPHGFTSAVPEWHRLVLLILANLLQLAYFPLLARLA